MNLKNNIFEKCISDVGSSLRYIGDITNNIEKNL